MRPDRRSRFPGGYSPACEPPGVAPFGLDYLGIFSSGNSAGLATKLDFTSGQEYLWVDPPPEGEPDIAEADAHLPMTAAFQSAGFSEIVLFIGYTGATFQYDELRVGTAFADVVSP